MAIVDIIRPSERYYALLYNATLVVGGSILIALSAQVSFILPFSPVPVTGQTFAVLLVGALMGASRGAAAVLAYLAEGIAGIPVFAGGLSGAAVMAGPTGGYLIGFVAAAYIVGLLADRGWMRNPLLVAAAMVAGNAAIYALGAAWVTGFVGLDNAIAAGVAPFLVGDVLKIAAAMLLLPAAHKILERR